MQAQAQLQLVPTSATNATNTPPKQYGGALVAEAIKEQGVNMVFTLTGGHIAPILTGANAAGIKVIDQRDEAACVFAADAYARLTQLPGVAVVTAGPGLSNTITAVKNAQLAESPVIILAGATAMILKGRGSLQDIDQIALMQPHCKACFTIKQVKTIIPTLRQAFAIAASGVPGPVFIEFPLEVLWPKSMIDMIVATPQDGTKKKNQTTPSFSLNTLKNKVQTNVTSWYLKRHFDHVFANAFDPLPPSSALLITQNRSGLPPVSSESLKAVLRALAASQRPLILLSSQVAQASKTQLLKAAIEILNVPVFCSGMARGLLGAKHPLLFRHNRKYALKHCDVIVLLGSAIDFRVDYGRHIGGGAYVCMVNLSAETLHKNSDIRSRNLKILGDSCDFTISLAQLASTQKEVFQKVEPKWAKWKQTLADNDAKREVEIDKLASTPAQKGVNPVRLCRAINAALDDDSIIVADGGDFIGTASYIVHPRNQLGWLDPGLYGTLGVGGGFACAAKALKPNSEVWLLFGDGTCAWSIAEIDTMVRHRLPCIIVIGTDAKWNQMNRDQTRLLKDPVASELLFSRYDLVGAGYGAEGILVANEAEVPDALKRAKEICKSGKPVVVNVFLASSSFREGSISL